MTEFNLQKVLSDMRTEQREDHQALMTKFDTIATVVNEHETRLVVVEKTQKSVLAMGGALTLAFFGALADAVLNHWGVRKT